MRFNYLPFTVLVITLIVSITSIIDAQPESYGENIFGVVEGMWYPDITCELNPGWERLIFDWHSHQPEGPDDWFAFFNIDDRWIQAANACNREIVAVVKNVPAWATDGSPGAGVPRGLYLPVDDPQNIWANFMRRAAEYYASRGMFIASSSSMSLTSNRELMALSLRARWKIIS